MWKDFVKYFGLVFVGKVFVGCLNFEGVGLFYGVIILELVVKEMVFYSLFDDVVVGGFCVWCLFSIFDFMKCLNLFSIFDEG